MIGQLIYGGRPIVTLEDDGTYTPTADDYKALAAFLNASQSPGANRQTGDGELPFGVAALSRAALTVKGSTVQLAQPVQPRPEGAV